MLVEDPMIAEQEWVEEQIRGIPTKPYFVRKDKLVISAEDVQRVVKRLKDRIWMDREGYWRLWYLKVIIYHTEEEYNWLKILLE